MFPEDVRRMAFRIVYLITVIELGLFAGGLIQFFDIPLLQAIAITLGLFAIFSLFLRQTTPQLFNEFYREPIRKYSGS